MATVLVVDDEFGIAELFDAILTDRDYRVLSAINGRQGLKVLATEHVDLMFLDFMMPVMDAAAMLETIMASPALQNIPVIVMSPLSEIMIAERCSGFAATLSKPFKVSQVVEMVERFTGKISEPVLKPLFS